MANWVKCQYHGLEQQHAEAGMNDRPVNLALSATFYMISGSCIEFVIPTKDNIVWGFINDATRDLELERLNVILDQF